MKHIPLMIVALVLISIFTAPAFSQTLSRADWVLPEVDVSHQDGKWTIAGKRQTVVLDEKTLAMTIKSGPVTWAMAPSLDDDLLVKSEGEEFPLRLSERGTNRYDAV